MLKMRIHSIGLRGITICGLMYASGIAAASGTDCGVGWFVGGGNSFDAGGWLPMDLSAGDVNGDGHLDFAVGMNNADYIAVLMGNGDGSFQPAVTHAAGRWAYSVAIGDVNGDHRPDLVSANMRDGSVSVLLGNGDGSFQAPVNSVVGYGPRSVAIGDLNGDGRPDLAVATVSGDMGLDLWVLLGNGDGTFGAPVRYGLGGDHVVIADLNGDDRLDLVVAHGERWSEHISVLLGNGDGTFAHAVFYLTGLRPQSVAIGDLNADGHLDLVTPNMDVNSYSVLLGNGDGTFGFVNYNLQWGQMPVAVAIGDGNGDGLADLAFAYRFGNISVLRGNGDGTFGPPQQDYGVPYTGTSGSLVWDDLDGDGLPDLAHSNNSQGTVSVLLNRLCPPDFDCDGFLTGVDFDLFVQAFEAGDLLADFDQDGFVTGIDFDLYVQAFEAGC